MQKDDEGFYTFKIDCKTNAKWTDTVTTLRLDPANLGGHYEFDYIRVCPDETTAYLLAEEQKRKEEAVALLGAVDNGAPFYIENADAEDVSSSANLTTGSTTVTIVEDDLREGNHVYKLVPSDKVKTWTYFRAKTRFKAGQTYKVEFDIRVLCDQYGNEGKDVACVVNPRYTDIVNGEAKNPADHALQESKVVASASDGWIRKSVTFTVGTNVDIRDLDEFSIFIDPNTVDGQFYNYSVMLDNFVVSVVEG